MRNLRPGRGLGRQANGVLGWGLGKKLSEEEEPPIIPVVEVAEYQGGGMRGDAWDQVPMDRIRRDILREDQEMLEIIIESILSGVIN